MFLVSRHLNSHSPGLKVVRVDVHKQIIFECTNDDFLYIQRFCCAAVWYIVSSSSDINCHCGTLYTVELLGWPRTF